ncbi:MAG: tRNA 2-selenouridine(34) synthase MnmH [Sarcina sp.]
MFGIIEYEEIHGKEDEYIFVDVRSESEFAEETITGAINIPILTDKEREIVGTTYVRESTDVAKKQGIEFASKRLPIIFEELQELIRNNHGKRLVIFCARGGMRSGSVWGLLNGIGISALKLRGGYKYYRAFVTKKLEEYSKEVKFIVLYGNTGIGKTEMLYQLRGEGYDVLDLEGAANHRGSVLGGVGLGKIYSQKKFETLMYDQLKIRKTNLVFTEGESRRIYKVIIPDNIWGILQAGEKVYITADLESRAERLVKEYTSFENVKEEILTSLEGIKKHASEENYEKYRALTIAGDYKTVAMEMMEKYYDPKYNHGSNKEDIRARFHANTASEACDKLHAIYEDVKSEIEKGNIEE